MPTAPVMPSRLEDVPAWLRHNARRLSFRILFLADELAAHLEHRQALEAVAVETGIRIVDLPAGLTDDERAAFMLDHLDHPARPAGELVGTFVGHVINGAARPPCPHCGDRFRTAEQYTSHLRDPGDTAGRVRPAHACPVLWQMRGGE